MSRTLYLALLATLLWARASWGQSEHPDDAPPASESLPVHRVESPDTPVGRQLAWVVKVINGQEPIGELPLRFAPRFIEEYKAPEITATLATLREKKFGGAMVDLVQINEEETADALTGIINGRESNRFLSVFIALDEKTGLISGLLFDQAGYSCAAGDWETFGGEFGRMSGSVSFAAYELVTEDAEKMEGPYRLRPVVEIAERHSDNVSTSARLWTLGAMAEQVVSGTRAWAEVVKVREEWKAVPGGVTASMAAGSEVTLAELATRALARNDSSAADHLLHVAGREAVEAYAKRLIRYQGRSYPVLSTREMLYLKLHPDGDVRARYAENMAEVRRELLVKDSILAGTPAWDGLDGWEAPRELERIGWFASVQDQCRVLADLRRLEQVTGCEAMAAFTKADSPVPLDGDRWTEVRHIAGAEPGVLAYAWLLRREDEKWFAVAMTWNEPKQGVDEGRFLDLARAGLEILGKEGKEGAAEP